MDYDTYRAHWATRTTRQVERELASWRRYMDTHDGAYAWHGRGMTPPGTLADGDKVCALQDILRERAGARDV